MTHFALNRIQALNLSLNDREVLGSNHNFFKSRKYSIFPTVLSQNGIEIKRKHNNFAEWDFFGH